MNSKQEVIPVLPKGSNPVGNQKIITVCSRRAGKNTAANEAMKEAFKTYVHPGVLQRAQQNEE